MRLVVVTPRHSFNNIVDENIGIGSLYEMIDAIASKHNVIRVYTWTTDKITKTSKAHYIKYPYNSFKIT